MPSIVDLNHNPWLAELSDEAREKLVQTVLFRRFVENQQVHSKMSPADGLYGVVDGEVRMSATTPNGEEIVFTRAQPGSWFGEIALLDGGVRTHDAHATTESQIAILPRGPLLKICDQYPDVYRSLVKLLCLHCRQAFNAIDDFLLFTPAQRMARRILERLNEGSSNYLPLNQYEIGAMIGISRQSANKILKAWEQEGKIERGYGGFTVVDRARLGELLDGS